MRIAGAVPLPRTQGLPAVRGRVVARISARLLGFAALSLLLLDEIGCPLNAYVDGLGRIYFATDNHVIARVNNFSGDGMIRFGEKGSGAGQFTAPWGIVTDRAGRIYVADSENHRIVRLNDMSGNGWTVFGRRGSGVGEFSSPLGLALDTRGRIYIADSGNRRVVRVDDISGAGWTSLYLTESVTSLPQYRPGMDISLRPVGIAVDRSGAIYFTDQQQSRIGRVTDISGAGLLLLGRLGSGVGEFMEPVGIAVDRAGRTYVADTRNHRIIRVTDLTGRGWVSFGSEGSEIGQFNTPTAVAIDVAGRIYVVDYANDRIVRMDNMNGGGWTVLDTYTGRSRS